MSRTMTHNGNHFLSPIYLKYLIIIVVSSVEHNVSFSTFSRTSSITRWNDARKWQQNDGSD